MKKTVYSLIIVSASLLGACKTTKQATSAAPGAVASQSGIILSKGQKITVTTSTTSDSDMGMGMQMKNVSSGTNVLEVIAVDDSSYTVTNTLTKMKMSMDMMGQKNEYDSDKPGDADSEIGKGISGKLNKADTVRINKANGTIAKLKSGGSPEREEENPMMGLMSAMGVSPDSDPVVEGGFYMLPKGKKAGDTWTDSTTNSKIKTTKTYTLKSLTNGVAVLGVVATGNGSGETEMQGTSMSFTLNSKSNGEMTVNTATNAVTNNTTDADVNMTMDVMGQSMPITAKTKTVLTYQ